MENTHNRAGGRIFPQADAVAIAAAAKSRGFGVHLDGARIWNASIALGIDVKDLSEPFDTVSVCFSKGLGAPAGSALCGSQAMIDQARFFRKRWGGGMRQSGILAAGALFALEHHRERLREDHYKAKKFASLLASVNGASVDLEKVETNIVNIDIEAAGDVVAKGAAAEGLLINASGPKRLRAVMHLDVSQEDAEKAVNLLAAAIAKA